jgi:hypothetical protein
MTNNLRITQATPPGDYIDGLPGNEDIQSVAITPENVADYSLDLAPIAPTAPVTGTDFDAIAFLSGLVGDNSQGMFRQVTADPASTDARGFVIDGLRYACVRWLGNHGPDQHARYLQPVCGRA